MRLLVLLGFVVALCGCSNMVLSDKPLFSAADARGAPAFRPGVWKFDTDDDCQVDLSRPVQSWPECATGTIYDHRGPITPPRELQTRLVPGNPLILQEDYRTEVAYHGARPLAFDGRDRITAYELWTVLCGPPPPPSVGEGGSIKAGGLTFDLLPGLEANGDNCKAYGPEAVRRAAVMSRGWGSTIVVQRWVRAATSADRMNKDKIYSAGVFRKDEAAPAPAP